MIDGGAGNDTIRAGTGNDTIYGGVGDDRLYGDAGNDTLIGGAGNDTLEGGAGNDLYLFSAGSGQDRVSNYDTSGFDVLRFDGIVLVDLTSVTRQERHLVIGYGERDSVTIDNYFLNTNYRIDQFEFEDVTLTGIEFTSLFGL